MIWNKRRQVMFNKNHDELLNEKIKQKIFKMFRNHKVDLTYPIKLMWVNKCLPVIFALFSLVVYFLKFIVMKVI